jgi:hypothetical protein
MTTTALTLPDRVQLEETITIDQALAKAFALLKEPVMGGATGQGWSRYRDLQTCPYLFYAKHVRHIDPGDGSPARSVGAVAHAFLALYYKGMMVADTPEPGALCDLLLQVGALPSVVNEAWRCFEAYANHWESIPDYLEPLAVEQLATDPETGNTCRYDLIARVQDHAKASGVFPGVYIVESKFVGRLDQGNVEGWHLDGEVIGQAMIWPKARLTKKYGPLQGIIMNLTIKTKVVGFERIVVQSPTRHLKRQSRDLAVWRAHEQMYRATGTWPRSLASCIGRFGLCDYFYHCRD